MPLLGGCSFDRISCATSACPGGLVCNAALQCILPPGTDGGPGDGPTTDGPTTDGPPGPACIRQLAAREDVSCAVRMDGTLWCWGDNNPNFFGISGSMSAMPVRVQNLTGVMQVALGFGHICVVAAQNQVYCWGNNDAGQTGPSNIGGTVATPNLLSNFDAVEVCAGDDHTCARRANGSVWCWGTGSRGQNGTYVNTGTPAQISFPNAAMQIVCGMNHTCVRLMDSTVYCWGANTYGQLGDSSTSDRPSPLVVAGLSSVVEIGSGKNHVCGRRSDHSLWCWGRNGSQQLGQSTSSTCSGVSCARSPIQTLVPQGFSPEGGGIVAGDLHTCVRSSGTVWCWGNQNGGQLGDGQMNGSRPDPAPIVNDPRNPLMDVTMIAAGDYHSCAAAPDGRVWCWGLDDQGQLGQTSRTNCTNWGYTCSTTPLQMPLLCP